MTMSKRYKEAQNRGSCVTKGTILTNPPQTDEANSFYNMQTNRRWRQDFLWAGKPLLLADAAQLHLLHFTSYQTQMSLLSQRMSFIFLE